jgi:inosine/xanthosine triphosphate pyrophosphatase family protein
MMMVIIHPLNWKDSQFVTVNTAKRTSHTISMAHHDVSQTIGNNDVEEKKVEQDQQAGDSDRLTFDVRADFELNEVREDVSIGHAVESDDQTEYRSDLEYQWINDDQSQCANPSDTDYTHVEVGVTDASHRLESYPVQRPRIFVATGSTHKFKHYDALSNMTGHPIAQIEITPDHEIQAEHHEWKKVIDAKARHAYFGFVGSKLYQYCTPQFIVVEDTALGFRHLEHWPGINIKFYSANNYKLLRTLVPRGGLIVQTISVAVIDVLRRRICIKVIQDHGTWNWNTKLKGYGYDPYVKLSHGYLAQLPTNPTRDTAVNHIASMINRPDQHLWIPAVYPISAKLVPQYNHDSVVV